MPLTLVSAVVADGRWAWHLAAPSFWLMGGCEMAYGKGTGLARRSRSPHKVVSQGNKVNVALPFSMIRAEEPVKMALHDGELQPCRALSWGVELGVGDSPRTHSHGRNPSEYHPGARRP